MELVVGSKEANADVKNMLGSEVTKSEQDPVRFWSRHMTTVTHGLPPKETASDGQRTKKLGHKYKLL